MNAATMEHVLKICERTLADLTKEVRLLQRESRARDSEIAALQAQVRKMTH